MIKNKGIHTLNEMPIEVRKYIEYKMVINHIQQIIKETTKKHSLPINYKYFWDLELEIHKTNKKLRGW